MKLRIILLSRAIEASFTIGKMNAIRPEKILRDISGLILLGETKLASHHLLSLFDFSQKMRVHEYYVVDVLLKYIEFVAMDDGVDVAAKELMRLLQMSWGFETTPDKTDFDLKHLEFIAETLQRISSGEANLKPTIKEWDAIENAFALRAITDPKFYEATPREELIKRNLTGIRESIRSVLVDATDNTND